MWETEYFHSATVLSDSLPKLEKWAMDNNDPELAYKFSIFRCAMKLSVENNKRNEEFEKHLEDVIVYATKNHMFNLLAEVDQELGNYYWNIRNKYGISLEYFIAAYQIYSKFTADEFPGKQKYIYDLGVLYYSYDDYNNAIKYLTEASNTKSKNSKFVRPINNSLGLSYMKLKKYDSSDFYFNKIYHDALAAKDTVWISIAIGNLGVSYFLQGKSYEAIPMLQEDIELSTSHQNVRNAAHSAYILAKIYYNQGNYAVAEQVLIKALNNVETKTFWPDYFLASHFYSQLHDVYEAVGDYRKSSMYADSALQAKDSLNFKNNVLSLARAQEKIDFTKHQLEVNSLMNEKKMQELISLSLIAGIVALCLIGILLVNKQRTRNKVLVNEKKMTEAERDNASRQLSDFTQHIQEKSMIIEQFANEIERYKKNEETEIDNETLLKLQQSTILTDEQWEDFRIMFEKVHKGFFNRVREKMPDLTPAEIRFVALSKLKLSSKEMASMLGISANSIRNYRLRFRRKLGLGEEAGIEEIVDAI